MREAEYMLKNIHKITGFPVHCLSMDGDVLFSLGFQDDHNPFLTDTGLAGILLSRNRNTPYLEFEDGTILYGILPDPAARYIVIGPCFFGERDTFLQRSFADRHHVNPRGFSLPITSLGTVSSVLSIVCHLRTGRMLQESDLIFRHSLLEQSILVSAAVREELMDSTENDAQRMSYADESAMLRTVQEGDIESICAIQNSASATKYQSLMEESMGKTAKNRVKHFEYMVCTAIALFCRAAVAGGMDANNAYTLSDVFLQRLERCRTVMEMMELSYEAQLEYATHVRHILDRGSRSSHVEKAKSYISRHMNKAFTINDIAEAIGISRSYLIQIFSQDTGIGVMEYTRNLRIQAAADKLKYTNESISNIAAYLCFNSQSHFGAIFKKAMGMTPRQYREKHAIIALNEQR